jgi:hypothetical protein
VETYADDDGEGGRLTTDGARVVRTMVMNEDPDRVLAEPLAKG